MDWSSPRLRQRFRRRLLSWFRDHARDLPWRRTRDVYHIWVSEIMLQQTQVATVVPYFERFIQRFPNVFSLADTSEDEVLRYWEGLGYYRRARQLHAAAKKIVEQHKGRFPTTVEDIQALPGIGRYTAGAILSIAHDARLPILEANTIRLLSRLLLLDTDPRQNSARKRLWDFSASLLPARHVGMFNQALMELGSTVCSPRSPRCSECPVATLCPTQARGWQDRIPASSARKVYEDVVEAALILASPHDENHVLLRRCGPTERWSGLWDFPRFAVSNNREEDVRGELRSHMQSSASMKVESIQLIARMKHGVTRYRITLLCYRGEIASNSIGRGTLVLPTDWRWVECDELKALPMSTTGRRMSKLVMTEQVQ